LSEPDDAKVTSAAAFKNDEQMGVKVDWFEVQIWQMVSII
jgi:hypothetical protein